jgi:hypothetical protein
MQFFPDKILATKVKTIICTTFEIMTKEAKDNFTVSDLF